MFPTFISILDIQSWWEVPSIAHFCSLFRTAFNLLDFDIEDLEEALLTDGTEESSWLQELIVRLLSGCLPNNEISTFNYQMFLRRLFRQKCQEHDRYNPFNTDIDFQILPLRTKVDILHALCDFRLDADDVLDQLKNLEADSLRVEPLGFDGNDSAYWYFYGTRLYREDYTTKNNKKKSVWQVICFTEDDWFQLTKKFKKSSSKPERQLHHTLSENFLPELPRLFKEKESLARKRLLENQPRRTSNRLRKLESETEKELAEKAERASQEQDVIQGQKEELESKRQEAYERRQEAYERRQKLKRRNEEDTSEVSDDYEMAGPKSKKSKNRQRKVSSSSTNSRDEKGRRASKRDKKQENNSESATKSSSSKLTTVGRQTNNSLSAATGQILIQPLTNPHKKKLKTSQVFRQTDEDLQTGMHKILDYVQNHEDAWPFADPVEEEYAPNYYTVIRKPMDLQRMEERLDSGYYKSYSKFRADFQLIVDNCRLYNGAENEYTEMVGNLLQVFEKATEKYLDQISSSDDEIAIEFVNEEVAKDNKTKKQEEVTSTTITSKRKPMLAAQTDKKRDRSPSEESFKSLRSNSYESLHEEIETKPARRKRGDIVEEVKEKQGKVSKSKVEESDKLETKNDSKKEKKEKPVAKKEKPDLKKEKQDAKKEKPDAKKEKLNAKNEKPDLKKEKSDVKREKSDAKKEKSDAKKEKSDGKKEKSDAKKEKPDTRKEKHDTTRKETKKDKSETKECETKKTKTEKKKNKHEAKKVKADKKAAKDSKSKSKKANRKEKKKAQIRGRSSSKSPSRSPPPSDLSSPPPSWPPSSPDSRFEFMPKPDTLKRQSRDLMESEDSDNYSKQNPFEDYFQDFEVPTAHQDKKLKKDDPPLSPKPKDKHNKLRETIEKLKAKSEMKLKTEFLFEPDQLKENKDKNKKPEKEDKTKSKAKEKPFQKSVKKDVELDLDNSTMDSVHSDGKKKKPAPKVPVPTNKSSSNMDALSIATEQTLKDINKWLDDTPKFSEFSSASNSPSYTGLDEFETLNNKLEQISGRKVEKPPVPKKENAVKDLKKRPFRDPSKFFKRREVQRTIDRLQPGKGKGNLISNVQNAAKTDEIFPLGPLSKMKDTKNSLIVKTDTNAPKLSLGSVLDSFGKHKFVDDQKKEPEKAPVAVSKEEKSADVAQDSKKEDAEKSGVAGVALVEEVKNIVESKTEKEPAVLEDASSGGGATPNLSAWFKAFGAPKLPAPAKKSDDKPEGKTNEKPEENKPAEARKVPIPAASPNTDSPVMPQGQPISRQRRISTGSSMSERSSFSQDMDSPRVGMDERGAYPAPYPSPLHRSPSGASPVMASPRPDISPKSAAYPTINGQIRVGFYQDTVSNKSSPDKSCSPRENPQQSPYPHYSEHVYTPNTTENAYYNYANSPYYTHAPNYSSTNPTPPYNLEGGGPNPSYYDTSKAAGNQTVQNYTANSPSSNASSPASHSPNVHQQSSPMHPDHSQPSPGVYSQHSPTVPPQHSPNIHAPNSPMMQVQLSPSVQTQNSPVMQQHSPNLLMPSPGLPAEKTPNVVLPEQSSVLQCSPELEAFQAPEDQDKMTEKLLQQQPQSAVFPVKKRAYNDGDLPQINKQRYEIAPMLTQQLEMKRNAQINHQASLVAAAEKKEPESKQYVHQNIPDPKTMNVQPGSAQPSPTPTHRENYPAVPSPFSSFGNEANYSLNIPNARTLASTQQAKIDLSKYTNMGYSGPDVNYTRALQQFGRTDLNYTATSAPSSQKLATQPALTTPSSTGDMSMRYGDPNVALQQMSYKGMELGCASTQAPRATSDASSDAMSDRLSQIQEASSGSNVARYNDVGRSMASLSHIVDRFGSEERMMAGLQQNTPSYYSDKGLGTAHIFNKPISTSASALPIFSQSNMAAMQSYSQNVQATTTSMYNRQMSELQNAAVMQNDLKASQQVQEKKSKKRKSSKNAVAAASSSESQQQSAAANQGFQSYAGLKGTASIEPSAISLKTSSVVPGSAFNFGPTPTGLGLGTGLYAAADKDAYPNFLDEFRSAAPNYYMAAAAAAAHHRATPETGVDKQTRPAHQSSNPQSAAAAAAAYPFLGAPQATRSSYPIGSPFMPNAQAQLMDTTSPLYQHYLQAGVLNQGLLGPPGAYPPGYHPALSMRQPYESMTRPPWL